MADRPAHRALGLAWFYLCCLLVAHGVEEAMGGFVDVWNPVLATVRATTGLPLPQFQISVWLGCLVVVVLVLLALTAFAFRTPMSMTTASVVFGAIMIVNGVNHLASPLYLGRFLPGQFTSPLLIASGTWLIVQARRVEGRAASPSPVVGSIVFFLVAPMTVVGWIPYAISGWRFGPPVLGLAVSRAVGGVLLVIGAAGLVDSFVRFALQGRGTPAPIAPPAELVVTGLYRYARNPMYICVLSAIVGQALLFGDVELLKYAGIVWLLAHTFVVAYEERALGARFGGSYDSYRSQVPRWLPRLRPWMPPVGRAAG